MFAMGGKVELISFVLFNSYELFIIPRLDSVIHNSGFSDSKYSLFIFVKTPLFIIHFQFPPLTPG